MKDESLYNLWQLYERIGDLPGYDGRKMKDFSIISGISGKWPSLIFHLSENTDPARFLERVAAGARKGEFPDTFIATREQFNLTEQTLLKEHCIYPVDRWALMQLELSSAVSMPMADPLHSIRKITKEIDVRAFTGIVNNTLLRNMPADPLLFMELTDCYDFDLYALFEKEDMVSGMVTFTRGAITGLYLVATRPDRQRQGLGSYLLSGVLNRLQQAGIQTVVLQSSRVAVRMYKKAGFTVNGDVYLYRHIQ